MTMPGDQHERLREDLDSLAILSGHPVRLGLNHGLQPDVARCNLAATRFFVGDAKDTETAATTETIRRLRAYLVQLAVAVRRGQQGTFAIAHRPPTTEWLTLLAWLCARLGLDSAEHGTETIAADMAFSWVALRAPVSATDRDARV